MKKLILMLMLASPVFGQADGNQFETSELYATSAIQWENTNIDLGKVKHQVPAVATFRFVNNSKQAVMITQVQPSCGCTATDYTQKPIPSGGTGTVNATFNAATTGAFRKQVTVSLSGQETPIVLVLSGIVE